jgi:NAD(P)-dependent dehydrogenase (short-subunit alcohol dehydrogenase family)
MRRFFRVNLDGFFNITQLAIAVMEKQGSGHVVQIHDEPGLAPTGKRRLLAAHPRNRPSCRPMGGQRAATAHPLEVQLSHSAKARRADRGVAHCAVFASVLSFSAGLTRTPAKEESFHRLRGLQHAFCRQAPS